MEGVIDARSRKSAEGGTIEYAAEAMGVKA